MTSANSMAVRRLALYEMMRLIRGSPAAGKSFLSVRARGQLFPMFRSKSLV